MQLKPIFIIMLLMKPALLIAAPCKEGEVKKVHLAHDEWEEFQVATTCQRDGDYRYYKEHRLHTVGRYVLNLRQGVFKVYDGSGRIRRIDTYKDHVLNGKRKVFYSTPEDVLKEVWHYKDGLVDGLHQKFDPFGALLEETDYRAGQVHGDRRLYEEYQTKAKSILLNSEEKHKPRLTREQIFADGELQSERLFKKGVLVQELKVTSKLGEVLETENALFATFGIQDIVGKERLSVILPSDTCRTNASHLRRDKDLFSYLSLKRPGLRCLDKKIQMNTPAESHSKYVLYSNLGFVREKGSLVNGLRQGLISFFKDGRPIYQRRYAYGHPASTVQSFESSKEQFELLKKRALRSAKKEQFESERFFAKSGDYQVWDGALKCHRALKKKVFHLAELPLSMSQNNGMKSLEHKNLHEELCHSGCARACAVRAEIDQVSALDYAQTACNLGYFEACNSYQREYLATKRPKPSTHQNCMIQFDQSCFQDQKTVKEVRYLVPCLYGDESACKSINKHYDQEFVKSQEVCKTTEVAVNCESRARRYLRSKKTDQAETLLKSLCEENPKKMCSPYAKFLSSSLGKVEQGLKVLKKACASGEQEACYQLAQQHLVSGNEAEAVKVLKGSCQSEQKDKIIDHNTMMASRSCRRLARYYKRIEKQDLASKYLCAADELLGYVKDCSHIKVNPTTLY